MNDDGCKQVLPLGGDEGSTRWYCLKFAEYWCEDAQGWRCLDHSHIGGCCERLDWGEPNEDFNDAAISEGISG